MCRVESLQYAAFTRMKQISDTYNLIEDNQVNNKRKVIMSKFNPEEFRVPTTGDYAEGGKLHNIGMSETPAPVEKKVVEVPTVKEGELVLIEYSCDGCGNPRGLTRAPVGMVITGKYGTTTMDLNPWEVESCGFNPEEVDLYIYRSLNCCG